MVSTVWETFSAVVAAPITSEITAFYVTGSERLPSTDWWDLVWIDPTCFLSVVSFLGWFGHFGRIVSSDVAVACRNDDYSWCHVMLRSVDEVRYSDKHPLFGVVAWCDVELGKGFSSVPLRWAEMQVSNAFYRSISRMTRPCLSTPSSSIDLLAGWPMTRKSSTIWTPW